MTFHSRGIDDAMVTHAVVVGCQEHGFGVAAWATEFEARHIAKSLDCGCAHVVAVTYDERGIPDVPTEATQAINDFLGIA